MGNEFNETPSPIWGISSIQAKCLGGMCGPAFQNHALGYGDWRTNLYHSFRKNVPIIPPFLIAQLAKISIGCDNGLVPNRRHVIIDHLNLWWLSLGTFICVTLPHILKPRQNCRHFADDIFKSFFLNENVWISLKISLKFVPKVRINNISALVQIMAWRRAGDKSLSESMLASFGGTYTRHSA